MPYAPPAPELVSSCIETFRKKRHAIDTFGKSVYTFFQDHPKLNDPHSGVIHSVKYRMKDDDHLREKIIRKKVDDDREISPDNLFKEVTDLAGIRILHLSIGQFSQIHAAITEQFADSFWMPFEPPVAYTWDPENVSFFEGLGLTTKRKDSHYTSVHYVVKPNDYLPITCEIQVRTLFEEAWGEIDHVLNYPRETESLACREQIRVLAKVVGAGTRLAEAIFRSHDEFSKGRDRTET